jgi:type IV pilus assembly protein PilM
VTTAPRGGTHCDEGVDIVSGRSVIGLDIGTSGVRAAEVSVSKGAVVLDRFGQVALPHGAVRDGEVADPEAVAAALRRLWKSVKFSSSKVRIGVANQRVVVRQVDLPWLPADELKDSLRFQVTDLVPMPVEDAVLDFVAIEELDVDGQRMVRGLLIAASQDMVLGAIRAAQQAGLEPVQVDLTPFAVLRSLGRSGAEWGSIPEAIVDVGARVTNIIVHIGGVPQFVRVLLMGGEDVTDALVERLGISYQEAESMKRVLAPEPPSSDPRTAAAQGVLDRSIGAFVDEVRGSVDYFLAASGAAPLARLVLSGGASRLPGLAPRLEQAVRAQVVPGAAFASGSNKSGLTADQLRFVQPLAAVPVGLAMGGER